MRRLWNDHQWTIVTVLAIVTYGLGLWGWVLYLAAEEPVLWAQSSFPDVLYRSLTLFVMEGAGDLAGPPWQLEVARFAAPALVVYTAIAALFSAFRAQLQMFHAGLFSDHVVVCGLGEKGFLIATGLRRAGRRVIVVELNAANGRIEEARDQGIVVLIGNATDGERLAGAGLARASHVFAVAGDDGVNAEVAVHARAAVTRRPRRRGLGCYVHISDPDLAVFLEERSIAEAQAAGFRLEIFNIHESGARALLRDFPPWAAKSPRPAVLGAGRLSRAFIVETARQWADPGEQRLPILLVDRDAAAIARDLERRFPMVAERCDLQPIDCDPTGSRCLEGSLLRDDSGAVAVSAIYICLGDDAQSLSAALGLRRHIRHSGVPFIVRTQVRGGLANLVGAQTRPTDEATEEATIDVFSLYDRTCVPEILMRSRREQIARAIHQGYLATNRRLYGDAVPATDAMKPWEELPEHYREANRAQADHIIPKLRETGCRLRHRRGWDAPLFRFTIEELEMLARAEHERWMRDRKASGWRHGSQRDERKKIHPDLVDWNDLAEDRRELDRDAVRKLPAYLAAGGFEIVREAAG